MSFIFFVLVTIACLYYWYKTKVNALKRYRENLIDTYELPAGVSKKILERYSHLSPEDIHLVTRGLKEYFHLCNLAGKKMVSMPSQAVDVAWHEFILFTRDYHQFCKKVFGRYLHHTPAEAMASQTSAQEGIKTAWRLACFREGLKPQKAAFLPLIFAMDNQLNIPDGFNYKLNCGGPSSAGSSSNGGDFCASHIGCGSGCSGSSCSSCSGSNSGCSSCSSGCGGGD